MKGIKSIIRLWVKNCLFAFIHPGYETHVPQSPICYVNDFGNCADWKKGRKFRA